MKNKKLLNLLSTKASARTYLAEHDIIFFASYYLAEHITSAKLPRLHFDFANIIQNRHNTIIVVPRGHGKSTWFSLIGVLHDILFKKEKFIVLISDTMDQSKALLSAIVQELETNERIIRDFGKIAGYIPPKAEDKKTWTVSEIVTTTNIKVIARGWKNKLRGIKHGAIRPTKILIDDLENDEAVNSQDQREKLKNVFQKSIMNIGNKDTVIQMVGTILHFDSLLKNLVDTPPAGFQTRFYKAIENEQPLAPELFTLEDLELKKAQIGSTAFEQEYMNNPIDESTRIFKPVSFIDTFNINDYFKVSYIDLAIGEKSSNDFTAIAVVGKHNDGHIDLLEILRFKGDVYDQLNAMFTVADKYGLNKAGVESVSYQKAFYQLAKAESMKRNIYVPFVEVTVDKDKVRRALEIQAFVENGTVRFYRHLDPDFFVELQQFPKGAHDDMVDAFVGAVKLAIEKNEVYIAPIVDNSIDDDNDDW